MKIAGLYIRISTEKRDYWLDLSRKIEFFGEHAKNLEEYV